MKNMNVIMQEEDRDFIKKIRKIKNDSTKKIENIRNDYKTKYIDTGKSEKFEKELDEKAKKYKKTIKIAGTLATIALIICPLDGPFGEICTILATPGLCKIVDLAISIQKKSIITGKRVAEKYLLKVDGINGKIHGYDLSNSEVIDDINKLKESVKGFSK